MDSVWNSISVVSKLPPRRFVMDSRSMSHTTPSNRINSRIYKDLAICRLPIEEQSNVFVRKLVMDTSEKVMIVLYVAPARDLWIQTNMAPITVILCILLTLTKVSFAEDFEGTEYMHCRCGYCWTSMCRRIIAARFQGYDS